MAKPPTTRARILDYLDRRGSAHYWTPTAISAATGIRASTARDTMRDLHADGELERIDVEVPVMNATTHKASPAYRRRTDTA